MPNRRCGRLHSVMIAAIGVQFLLSAAALGEVGISPSERTRVQRISASVVQVLRELVERGNSEQTRDLRKPGFRVCDSRIAINDRASNLIRVRMIDAMLTDLPPPVGV